MGVLLTSAIIAFAILVLFLLNFYRDPERKILLGNSIVSPADGKIMRISISDKGRNSIKKGILGKIESLTDDISSKCFIISIFMSPLDVHINRSPVPGEVMYVKHTPGRYFAAFNLKKSLMNEKNEVIIKNKDLGKVKVNQIAPVIAMGIFQLLYNFVANIAYGINVGVTSIIITLPISMVIIFLLSVVWPKLLEKHTLKVYAIRFASAAIMIWGALQLSR